MIGIKVGIWIFVLAQLIVGLCGCTDPTSESVKQGDENNPQGPVSDEEVLELDNLSGLEEPTQAGEQEKAQPQEWQEPKNKMTLGRLLNGRYYQTQYAKMNDLLVKKVQSKDFDANMKVLSEWLASEKQKGVNMFNRATVEALEQVLSLNKITPTNRCNRETYAILFRNDQATGGRTHKKPSELGPLRRIDSLVNQVAQQHSDDCFKVYPEEYKRIRDTVLDQKTLQTVGTFMEMLRRDNVLYYNVIDSDQFGSKLAAKLALKLIESLAHNDPDRRYLSKVLDERTGTIVPANEAKIKSLFKRYLTEPCREYNRALGPDVVIPSRYDLEMTPYDPKRTEDTYEFRLSRRQYDLCKSLINRDEPVLVKNIVASLSKP